MWFEKNFLSKLYLPGPNNINAKNIEKYNHAFSGLPVVVICLNAAKNIVARAKNDDERVNRPIVIKIAHTDSEKAATKPKNGFAKSKIPPKYFVKADPSFSHLAGFIILLQP